MVFIAAIIVYNLWFSFGFVRVGHFYHCLLTIALNTKCYCRAQARKSPISPAHTKITNKQTKTAPFCNAVFALIFISLAFSFSFLPCVSVFRMICYDIDLRWTKPLSNARETEKKKTRITKATVSTHCVRVQKHSQVI